MKKHRRVSAAPRHEEEVTQGRDSDIAHANDPTTAPCQRQVMYHARLVSVLGLSLALVTSPATRRWCPAADAYEHRSSPRVTWRARLPPDNDDGGPHLAGPALRRGNGIVPDPTGARLFVTTDDGTLSILDASDGSAVATYRPDPVEDKFTVTCSTSVSLTAAARGGDRTHALYAVTDIPPPERWTAMQEYDMDWYDREDWFLDHKYQDFYYELDDVERPQDVLSVGRSAGDMPNAARTTSRLLAVDDLGHVAWTYTMPGVVVVGTPRYSSDGNLVYVLTNDAVTDAGRMQVLRLDPDQTGALRVTRLHDQEQGGQSSSGNAYPYSPLAMTTQRLGGTLVDTLYWVETLGDRAGYSHRGRLHQVRIDTSAEPPRVVADSLEDGFIGSAVAPRVSVDGMTIDVSGKKGKLLRKKWTTFASYTHWMVELDRSNRNETMPVINSAVALSDESLLYIPSSATSFYCLNPLTGEQVWRVDEGKSAYLADARVSHDDQVVYSVQHMDGTVEARDAQAGDKLWDFDCQDLTDVELCQDSVEMDFVLSPDGSHLFYGDVFGSLTALEVAEGDPTLLEPPTSLSPSAFPSDVPTTEPTVLPSLSPSGLPTRMPSPNPTSQPTSDPTIPVAGTSRAPTSNPTTAPTELATEEPSMVAPTASPSLPPSTAPLPIPDSSPPTTSTETTSAPSVQSSFGPTWVLERKIDTPAPTTEGVNGRDGTDPDERSSIFARVSVLSPAGKTLVGIGASSFVLIVGSAVIVGALAYRQHTSSTTGTGSWNGAPTPSRSANGV